MRMAWHRSVKDGCWYSSPVDNREYRCRSHPRIQSCWWPEYRHLNEEGWSTLRGGGVSLAEAKALCKGHWTGREVDSPLKALADRWEAEAARLYAEYQPKEDYPHVHGQAAQLRACAYELKEVLS